MRSDETLAERLLQTIEADILPLTKKGVSAGNKIFGAALLRKDTLETYLAETNNEIENPLWHGEMHTLKRYYEIPAEKRLPTSELLFLSTHEPCSLCLSAITWCGFDNFYYFFSYQDSRDEFAIPHDLKILKEVFGQESYCSQNEFWNSHSVYDLIAASDKAATLQTQATEIKEQYAELSSQYQKSKADNDIPMN